MKNLSGNQIRKMFLDYFASKGHMIEPGVSLVPVNDPTLLWINAGVAGLKKYFDGREKPTSNRICNAQKCIRTNDIENVGKTARHHTFFEMLGNFSIGDYFKEDALKFAYEFLTSKDWIGFDPERLYVTVYSDDEEAYRIWTEVIGFNPKHILKTTDNFWQIGEGPCGPDSEIFYDRGEKYDPEHLGERAFFEELENDRYIEVWNVVFSQFDAKDGVERKDYNELPQKNIDTGMGLERLTALVQDGETNFDTDLFLPYIHKTEEYALKKYSEDKIAFRVIADHIRTCVFALADGAVFSNEGRGYVLRRVLRRAMRYGKNIGIDKPFLFNLVDTVCDNMKDYYPYLQDKKDFIKKLILKEEESFLLTLTNGEKLLNEELNKAVNGVLSGEIIFKLYDTYGFPKEMTVESAQEKGIECDLLSFEKCMENQRQMARNARDVDESMHNQSEELLNLNTDFSFTGYEKTTDESCVVALFDKGVKLDEITSEGDVVFSNSCFYATSGGQCCDSGTIENDNCLAQVVDVSKAPNGQFLHHIKVIKGSVSLNDKFTLKINVDDRQKIRANHSSLHLLQAALRTVLGDHVAQAGSYVCKDYARFDFSHYEKINEKQINDIELLVNQYINNHYPVKTEVLSFDEAKKTGAIALFDEKYGDTVRVVSIGDVSKEFCGGTHVNNSSELGSFKIVSEESIGSGIRRMEVLTQMAAFNQFKEIETKLNSIRDLLKLKNSDMIFDRLNNLINDNQSLNNQLKVLNDKLLNEQVSSICANAKNNGKYNYLLLPLNNSDADLKDMAFKIRNKLDGGFVFIANKKNDKVSLLACGGENALENGVSCGNIISTVSKMIGGKGGGKADMAQGGGPDFNLDIIINEVDKIINSIV